MTTDMFHLLKLQFGPFFMHADIVVERLGSIEDPKVVVVVV